MKTYILSIAGVILLASVFAIITPNGKTGSFIRGMMKLLILAVIVAPMIGWLMEGDFDFASSEIAADPVFLEQCSEIVSGEDGKEIGAYLLEEFGVTAETEVKRSADGRYSLEKITVKIVDFGIFGQDEHIDIISRIQSALEEKYGCAAEVAEFYDEVETDPGE